jgi:signal transduction histidine kinase
MEWVFFTAGVVLSMVSMWISALFLKKINGNEDASEDAVSKEHTHVKLHTEIENERYRISTAIHDHFGSRLTVSIQRIEKLYRNPTTTWPFAELLGILNLLRGNMQQMREVVWNIAPAELEYVSLGDAVG